jgi:NAD(P)-dependent dehydrogenase (short-subunit alcohol dehydrogenase family)
LDCLRAAENARVVNVSSLAHRFASLDWDNLNAEKGFRSFPTYGLSKLCNILFTKKLANYVQQDGITSNALHPGGVATNFGKGGSGLLSFIYETVGNKFMLSPEEGAATSIYLATSPDVEGVSGEYFVKKKKVFPSTLAMSSINAEKLWDISMQLTGIETFGKP